MFTCQVALKLFDYFQINDCRNLRNLYSKRLMLAFARVDVVKHSFFYCVIPKWNSLPGQVVNHTNSDIFLTYAKHISQRINICVYILVYTFVSTSFVAKCFFQ